MRRLLRLYPRAWRRRYSPEMEALLAQTPPTPRAVLDLLRGALDAHLHQHSLLLPPRAREGWRAARRRRLRWTVWALATAGLAALDSAFLALRGGQPRPLAVLLGAASTALTLTAAWFLLRRRRRRRWRGWGPDDPEDPGHGARVPAPPLPDAPPALAAVSRGSGRRSDPE